MNLASPRTSNNLSGCVDPIPIRLFVKSKTKLGAPPSNPVASWNWTWVYVPAAPVSTLVLSTHLTPPVAVLINRSPALPGWLSSPYIVLSNLTFPTTCKFWVGFEVPIPTEPIPMLLSKVK